MLFYLVQANFVVIALVVFNFVFLATSRTMDKAVSRIFMVANTFVAILVVADSTDYYFESQKVLNSARYITSAIGYTLRPGVILLTVYNLRNRTTGEKKYTYVPFLINGILAFMSIFNKIMFGFDENNEFYRGPLGWLPFAVSAFYLIMLSIRVLGKRHVTNKNEYAVIYTILCGAVVSTAMESIFKFKFMNNGVSVISLIFFYFFLYSERSKKDAMTNAFNRHTYNNDIEGLKNKRFLVVSVDINNLKMINDKYGHDTGDKAIISVAKSIISNLRFGCFFYRIGGDEFVILCPNIDKRVVEDMMIRATRDSLTHGYEFSWGMAEYKPGMDYAEVYKLSDINMYEMKKHMH